MVTRTFEQMIFKWYSASLWTDVPPANSVIDNCRISVLNMGSSGISDWVTDGVRWYPIGGTLMLAALAAPVALIANVETIVLQALIPAGAWQVNDVLALSFDLSKSGATDTGDVTVRIGTAGTVIGDTPLTGLTAAPLLAAANLSGSFSTRIKLLAAASAQQVGNAGAILGGSNAAISAATVIPSAAANALFVSLSIASSGLNDTVGIESAQLQLITP